MRPTGVIAFADGLGELNGSLCSHELAPLKCWLQSALVRTGAMRAIPVAWRRSNTSRTAIEPSPMTVATRLTDRLVDAAQPADTGPRGDRRRRRARRSARLGRTQRAEYCRSHHRCKPSG